jgi:hypothetical protein
MTLSELSTINKHAKQVDVFKVAWEATLMTTNELE